MANPPQPRPASTVVLLRESAQGPETLLLRRNKALMFAGGFWVFPGGALEEQDLAAARGDTLAASKVAAAREAEEESGLQPDPEQMVLVSHWTTPEAEPRRFSTWIYAAPITGEHEVVIDGGEIHDHLWINVRGALARHNRGDLPMLPPTLVTLLNLASYESVAELVAEERVSTVPEVLPVFTNEEGVVTVMFPGDAGYDNASPSVQGARHRAVLKEQNWVYQYENVSAQYPALVRRRS